MSTLALILLFTFLGSIVSLIGGVLLLFKEKFALKISHYLSSFAAGALLGTVFFDLLPEAVEEAETTGIDVFFWCLMGILGFFLLERFIHWFHHHHEHAERQKKSALWLINLGDGIHNFIDGVAIAGTFLIDPHLGIVTSLAVAAHEIPQEIGNFGVLLHRGYSRKKVLLSNLFSASTAFLGAILTYVFSSQIENFSVNLLAIAAGFFIYIAASDLIPEIHNEDNRKVATLETILLLVGVLTIYIALSILASLGLKV